MGKVEIVSIPIGVVGRAGPAGWGGRFRIAAGRQTLGPRDSGKRCFSFVSSPSRTCR